MDNSTWAFISGLVIGIVVALALVIYIGGKLDDEEA